MKEPFYLLLYPSLCFVCIQMCTNMYGVNWIKWFVIGAMMSDTADPFVVLALTYGRLWLVNL